MQYSNLIPIPFGDESRGDFPCQKFILRDDIFESLSDPLRYNQPFSEILS
jgi:hypothetical protein